MPQVVRMEAVDLRPLPGSEVRSAGCLRPTGTMVPLLAGLATQRRSDHRAEIAEV